MNVQRAKEIAASPDMKHVTYNGEAIYIQHVDEQNETARIYSLNDRQHEQVVSVDSLQEH
ncbi:MAG TPA: small acid-soluble spore protein H [Bacilli bacterium]